MVRFPATQQALPSNKCKCSFKLPQFLLLNYSFKYQFYYFICTSLETTTTCMLDSLCLYSILNLFSFIYFSYLVFLHLAMGFPSGSDGKASVYNAGDPGLIPGLGRSPGRRKWQPTPVLLPKKSHGQRSLVGYSPWGCKESDMTD